MYFKMLYEDLKAFLKCLFVISIYYISTLLGVILTFVLLIAFLDIAVCGVLAYFYFTVSGFDFYVCSLLFSMLSSFFAFYGLLFYLLNRKD